jgi:hypothetical protein
LLLIAAFAITLAESISKHGLLQGFIRHGGVRVVGALALLGLGIAAAAGGGYLVFGESGIVGALFVLTCILYYWGSRGEALSTRTPHSEELPRSEVGASLKEPPIVERRKRRSTKRHFKRRG